MFPKLDAPRHHSGRRAPDLKVDCKSKVDAVDKQAAVIDKESVVVVVGLEVRSISITIDGVASQGNVIEVDEAIADVQRNVWTESVAQLEVASGAKAKTSRSVSSFAIGKLPVSTPPDVVVGLPPKGVIVVDPFCEIA